MLRDAPQVAAAHPGQARCPSVSRTIFSSTTGAITSGKVSARVSALTAGRTALTVASLQSAATRTGTCSSDRPRLLALPPDLPALRRALRSRFGECEVIKRSRASHALASSVFSIRRAGTVALFSEPLSADAGSGSLRPPDQQGSGLILCRLTYLCWDKSPIASLLQSGCTGLARPPRGGCADSASARIYRRLRPPERLRK